MSYETFKDILFWFGIIVFGYMILSVFLPLPRMARIHSGVEYKEELVGLIEKAIDEELYEGASGQRIFRQLVVMIEKPSDYRPVWFPYFIGISNEDIAEACREAIHSFDVGD